MYSTIKKTFNNHDLSNINKIYVNVIYDEHNNLCHEYYKIIYSFQVINGYVIHRQVGHQIIGHEVIEIYRPTALKRTTSFYDYSNKENIA
jgi:hypothetical protein